VGGDSPDKLIRFPGEPASPMLTPLDQSLVFAAMLVAKEVPDTASNTGEVVGFPLDDGVSAFSSGDRPAGGEEVDPAASGFRLLLLLRPQ
jgi:hypothetical protein